MRLNSLRTRTTAAFAFAFAALTLLFVCLMIRLSDSTAERTVDTALKTVKNGILSRHITPSQISDTSAWRDIKEALAMQNMALLVVDAHGNVLQKTEGRVPVWPTSADGRAWRLRTIALEGGTVVIGRYWQDTDQALRYNAAMLLLHGMLLLVCATFGVWYLVGRTLSPIDRLARQADRASTESLHLRLETPSQDAEIVHLVGTLNGLLARLSEEMATRGRFYAAASHELRTPLQTLTGTLEVGLMQPRDADEYREILAESSEQAGRLAGLIQALLLLNQVEMLPAPLTEQVDLAAACDRWLNHFQSLGVSRDLCVDARLPESLCLEAAPAYVDILLRNLLENAFKYAHAGSPVRLTLQSTAQGASLTVFNECAPLPEKDVARLMEPFYRPDASRNSDAGGNGLGLAICKAIAHSSGWTLSLHHKHKGIEVNVLFLA